MDWMTFAVEISKALAWPGVVLLALTLYREPLTQLISTFNILRVKVAGTELEVEARNVKILSESIQLPLMEQKKITELSLLAQESPKLAIQEAWRDVEASVRTSLNKGADMSPAELKTGLESLGDSGILKYRLFTELKQVRDKAVHLPEYVVSTSTAENYTEAAQKLANYLQTKRDNKSS
jgi:hypothetical protein